MNFFDEANRYVNTDMSTEAIDEFNSLSPLPLRRAVAGNGLEKKYKSNKQEQIILSHYDLSHRSNDDLTELTSENLSHKNIDDLIELTSEVYNAARSKTFA